MKILRARKSTISLWEFQEWLNRIDHNEVYNKRIGISWKIGKRRKLRSYHFTYQSWTCECCGPITEITLTKNGKTITIDNHLGLCHVGISSF